MRKFEKISYEQFEKDFVSEFPDVDADDLKEKYYDQIKLPKRATELSVGYDFFTYFAFELKPGEEIKIPTGIKIQLDKPFKLDDGQVLESLDIYPRSGQGFKFLRVANTVGVIDPDYYNNENNEGAIWIKLRNESNDYLFSFEPGDAFCQGKIHLCLLTSDDCVDEDSSPKREGGLGSTDACKL
jgi:dUTP pyrophosphatase